MGEHEQLGLGVGRSPDGRASQPGVADLTDVGRAAAARRMSLRPRPSFHVPEARGTDDGIVIQANGCKWYCRAGISPRQGSVNVAGGLEFALRNRTPLIERGISRRRGHQPINVPVFKRFKTNMPALQHKTFRAHSVHVNSVARCYRLLKSPLSQGTACALETV